MRLWRAECDCGFRAHALLQRAARLALTWHTCPAPLPAEAPSLLKSCRRCAARALVLVDDELCIDCDLALDPGPRRFREVPQPA